MKIKIIITLICCSVINLFAIEYHVSKSGDDNNEGSLAFPFLTIQKAANLAQPGDVITVHEGIYREEVAPPRGGVSDEIRITYQAAINEHVVISGAEQISNWEHLADDVWRAVIPNSLWGSFNPFEQKIHGDWFNDFDRESHLGAVYIDNEWLMEADSLNEVLTTKLSMPLWFAEVGEENTTIWGQFGKRNPNEAMTEVNVRETVLYPRQTNINYITVCGFEICKGSPNWAPPTAEQKGIIGTHWSKGWIIENNNIRFARCTGLSLGKYGDEYDNTMNDFVEHEPMKSYYIMSVERATKRGWNKETIGGHMVRNNEISYCEQAGIVGSMGASFSQILHNHIHHIHVQKRYGGAEMAAIKFHAPIDMLIKDNRIHDTCLGLWLDWMTQGTRVSCNLFYRNGMDFYAEVNHGPYVVDNNLFLSGSSRHLSQGGAFVHNIWGRLGNWEDPRYTPYFEPHSTVKKGDHQINVGDDHFYNNFFVGAGMQSLIEVEQPNGIIFYHSYGLECYNKRPMLPYTGGNVYFNGAKPCDKEVATIVADNPLFTVIEKANTVYLQLQSTTIPVSENNTLVNTDLLGKAIVPDAYFEDYDGRMLVIDTDYFGHKRNLDNPTSGPFEIIPTESVMIWSWGNIDIDIEKNTPVESYK